MGTSLKELSVEKADKQPHLVENMLEEAPILAGMPFEESSNGFFNLYEEVDDVTGAGFVEMNAPLPAVDVQTGLKKVDLAILGGEIECPEDTAKMYGGKEKYFAKKLPKVMRKTGMDAEKRILYDNFRQYAIDKGNATSAGTNTGGGFTMLAVRYITGEVTGLYSPECWKGGGTLLDMMPINNGALYKGQSGKLAGVLVYGMRLKSYLGMMLANPKAVACLINVNATNMPTATMIDDLLASAQATPQNTKLYMHEKCKTLLYDHKGKSLQVAPAGKDMDRTLTHWNGVEIVTSYNFLDGTETYLSLG